MWGEGGGVKTFCFNKVFNMSKVSKYHAKALLLEAESSQCHPVFEMQSEGVTSVVVALEAFLFTNQVPCRFLAS